MILAAGLGTRLRPLTEDRPKALVEVAGRTMLEIALSRLRGFGIYDVSVNVHHFADMVVDYLESHHNFGMRVVVSREETLLDTGGGLKKAAPFFLHNSGSVNEPFLLHNVDVVSTIDLSRMLEDHLSRNALATLAVQDRRTSRYLLFDEHSELCGRESRGGLNKELVRTAQDPAPLAFAGIHFISTRLLEMMRAEGSFSIIDTYLTLAAKGERILGYRTDGAYWCDLGSVESIEKAVREREKWA
jgi:NDP-sugar pyrophosphorylase family protein